MSSYNDMITYIKNSTVVKEKLGTDALYEVLNYMGNPQKKLKVIHVGGTNGKGSTSAFISQILEEAGYKVGLYTSPYLEEFNERIQINRKNISDEDLVHSFNQTTKAIDKFIENGNSPLSEFEIITATAYHYFLKKEVDFVVLEVGLGGENDATNTCVPIISALTSISMDHMDFLGNDIKEISLTKAGIIKNNIPVVIYSQKDEVMNVIKQVAKEKKSELYITNFNLVEIKESNYKTQKFNCTVLGKVYKDIEITLNGTHQIKNFITALSTIKVLEKNRNIKKIEIEIIKKAAFNTRWNGRLEILKENPLSIIDGAHNYDGALSLCEYLKNNFSEKKIIFVFGMLKDKEYDKVISEFIKISNNFILLKPNNPRAEEPNNIKKLILEKNCSISVEIAENVKNAIKLAEKKALEENFIIVYAGSLYMIGEVRTLINN